MKTRFAIAACVLLLVVVYFCLITHSHGQAFTPRRPFILQSAGGATNYTPEQLAEFQVAFRWVAHDLGTNALNVNTWTDRIQGAIWRMDDATKQPSYATNTGISFNTTHWLTNNVLGSCLNGQSNMLFGLVVDIIRYNGLQIRPTLFNNGLPGAGSVNEDQYSLENGINAVGDNNYHPLFYKPTASQSTYGIPDDSSHGYPLTNLWHTLMLGQSFSNILTIEPQIFIITNGQWMTNFHLSAWTVGAGWGGPNSYTGNRSNFPTSLGYNYWRASSVIFDLQEFWIWTNTALSYGYPSESVITNFWYYASTNYGF